MNLVMNIYGGFSYKWFSDDVDYKKCGYFNSGTRLFIVQNFQEYDRNVVDYIFENIYKKDKYTTILEIKERIESLEKKLAQGVTIIEKTTPELVPAPVEKQKQAVKPAYEPEVEEPQYYDAPLLDEPPVEYSYEPTLESAQNKTQTATSVEKEGQVSVEPPKTEEKKPVLKQAVAGDAKNTFGTFLRALRKTGRNGVLYTICMDLDYAYEDGLFVLYTESESMYRSIMKAEHYALIKQAFEAVGMSADSFTVRLRGKQADDFNKGFEELKNRFAGVKVDLK